MILYDGIVFSLQRTGGISVLFSELFSRLPAAGFEVQGFRPDPPPGVSPASYRPAKPRRVERYRSARLWRSGEIFSSTYYRLPDRPGPRVVTTVYDFVYERYAPLHRRIVHSAQKRRAILGSDRLICISESTRRDLIEFVGPAVADRALVVHLGASTEFRPIPGIAVLPQVLFVGSRVHYKNFSGVVAALSGLAGLDLVCVGGGSFTPEEREMLDRLIPGRYRAAGYLSTAELNLEYNRALCLVYPSVYEGFGIPVVEAMQAGCPVVAVNASSIPEVAGDAGILLERGDPDEIRAALDSLHTAARRELLSAAGLVQARKFSWDSAYRGTVAVYEDMLGKKIGR